MKLALTLSYSGAQMSLDMERILEVERLGFDSVWSAESYGSDAVTPAAWIAARTARIHVGTGIMQLADRKSTSELQSRLHLVCRLLLEKKKTHRVPRAQTDRRRPSDRQPVSLPA